MKSSKLIIGLVFLILVVGAAVYLIQLAPTTVKVFEHERKIGDLEKRATSAEQKLDEHDKRIAVLESSVKVMREDLTRTQTELSATRTELQATEKKLAEVDARVTSGDEERLKLVDEVTVLRKKLEALEKDLVKRIEVLEKLTESKAQR